MPAVKYYVPSGKFGVGGAIVAALGGSLAAALLGAIYGSIAWWNPFMYVNFLGSIVFGFGISMALGMLFERGHIRAPWVAHLVALGVGSVGLYFAWMFWLRALLAQAETPIFPWDPLSIGALVFVVSENGAWSLSSYTPTGAVLWVIWLLEAAIVVGIPVLTAGATPTRPYCETSGTWFTSAFKDVAIAPADPALLKQEFEAGRFDQLAAQPIMSADSVYAVTLTLGKGPPETGALTVAHVTRTRDSKGKESTDRMELISNLLLRGEALEAAKAIPQVVSARAAG